MRPARAAMVFCAPCAALLISACATANTPRHVDVQTVCVPMANYTPAQERDMANAVALLPPDNPILGMIADYSAMRSADRACLKGTKP